jgi:hypothetical protein
MNSEPIVFLHIPKTGGIAVRKALKTGFSDLHVLVHRGKARLTLTERVAGLGIEKENPLIISVIRHPVERLLSAYWYLKNGGTRHTRRDAGDAKRVFGAYKDFEDFVTNGGLQKHHNDQVHLRPQSFWMRSGKKGDKFTLPSNLKLFRYEEMNVRLALFLSKKSSKTVTFSVANATKNKQRTEITTEMRKVIEEVYSQDLEIWNAS